MRLQSVASACTVNSFFVNMADHIAAASASFLVLYSLLKKKNNKKKRRMWSSQFYLKRRRVLRENSTYLLKDLWTYDNEKFHNFVRMSKEDFDFILNGIRDTISKNDTNIRQSIPAEERLALTLRFLATGDSFTSLQYLFRVSKQVISRSIVPEVCDAIIKLLNNYVKLPASQEDWKMIADKFDEAWNFPKCLGALDGKHIVLQSPIKSGSDYFNYKSQFSIVLMALADADYKFAFVDIGCQGRISDGGVFKNCELYKRMEKGTLNLPDTSPLPGRQKEIPYVFVADAAFALKDNMMKPFFGIHPKASPKRIFNYRLSRARRVIENVFGIVSSVFRVLRKPLLLQPDKAEKVVMAVVYLHNFLRSSKTSRNIYTPHGSIDTEVDGKIIPGSWRSDSMTKSSLLDCQNVPRRAKLTAEEIRMEFTEYFCTTGEVPWQNIYA